MTLRHKWKTGGEKQKVAWNHDSITTCCCKNTDIYQGMFERMWGIMGSTKSLKSSGGLWMWRCYVTICSKFCSQLSSLSLPLPLLPSVSFLSCPLHSYYHFCFLTLYRPHTNSFPYFLPVLFIPIFISSPPFRLTQLHQLRRRMSATTIMPYEGTVGNDRRRGTDRRGGRGLRDGAEWRKEWPS